MSEPEALRAAFHRVVRRFGLLESASTPCGQPIPVSLAHGLMELLERPALRQGELAVALGLTKSATSRLVTQMERRGWVEREGDEVDGRAWRLALTRAGARVATQVNGASLARFGAVLEAIPSGRRETVRVVLETLSEAIASLGTGRRANTARNPNQKETA